METAIAEAPIFLSGPALALLGAAFASSLGGIGSALGLLSVGRAASGVAAEKPEISGKLIVLAGLPASQALYGMVVAFMVFRLDIKELDSVQGASILFACLPFAFSGLLSGIAQGKVAASATQVVAKDESKLGMAIVYSTMAETVAIFGLLVSLLAIRGI